MIGILGGGLAGLTVAKHCKQECEVLEASDRVGGHCKSTVEQGYTFDEGPHIIFSKNKKTLDYMLSLLGDNVVQGRRNNKIYYKGQYIKYPFENGIGELEPQDKFDCLYGYMNRTAMAAKQRVRSRALNFRDWLYSTFGYGLTDQYLLPYNEKIWKCSADEMAYDWADERLPKTTDELLLKSACGLPTEGYQHQLNFYYPKTGGIESLVKAMAVGVELRRNCVVNYVIRMRTGGWTVASKSYEHRYDKIVSTLPLVEMVDIFSGAPQEIKDAAKQLRFNSLVIVTIGQDLYDNDLTALYVPDPKLIFHRLSFPINFSKQTPGLIQAEITTNTNDDVWNAPDTDIVRRVISDIESMPSKCGIGPAIPLGKIVYAKVLRLKYGYPVPTFSYRENLKKVRTYFEEQGVILCGRNAEFEYINMDQCIEHGIQVAEQLNG